MDKMKNFKQLIKELPSKKVIFAFGRFQPPTTGHELLVKAVKQVAGSSADHVIYASKTEDKKDNPLPVDRKIYFLKRMFPGTNFKAADQNVRTFIEAAKELNNKYKNIVMVAGSDRVTEYQSILEKYNGIEFDFDTIEVVSAGERDPDSDSASGMSGTKMREAAKAGDFNKFKKGVPHNLTDLDSRRLMNDIRLSYSMDPIKEAFEFSRSTVREQYISGSIFNIGDKVQDDNGTYEIMDRGANYITVVNESGQLSKKWIDKVTSVEISEDVQSKNTTSEISFKGYTTKNLHQSADALKAFEQTITKYNEHLITDGVAILNALKSTDSYMKLSLLQTEVNDQTEICEWISAHSKVKESLERISEFAEHMDYWNSYGAKLQEITNNAQTEDTMIKEKLKLAAEAKLKNEPVTEAADPIETKKIMMTYKDYLKKATTSEPAVDIGKAGIDPIQAKSDKSKKKKTESDFSAELSKPQADVSEDIYTSDTTSKDYMMKDAEGNWVWKKRKSHPKRVTFAASRMGGSPDQKNQQDEQYVSEAADVAAHEHPYNRPHNEPSVPHTKLKAGEHARAPYNRIVFGGALSKMWHAKNKSGQVKAFVNSDAAKKHALSEEVEIEEAGAFSYGAKTPRKGTEKYKIAQANKKYLDSRPVIEPDDQMVGKAKVTKPLTREDFGTWLLNQDSELSEKTEELKKKVKKSKGNISDKETFDPKNAGGSPPFDPFFEEVEDNVSDQEIDTMVQGFDTLEDILEVYEDDEIELIDSDTGEVIEQDEAKELVSEVLSRSERIRAKVRFAQSSSKRKRAIKISLRSRSSTSKINTRARKLAVALLKQRIAKKPLNTLSVSEKERLEKIIQRRKKVVTRIAMKLTSKIRKIENDRLAHKKK